MVVSDDDDKIINPTREDLLDLIDYGEDLQCSHCNAIGNFKLLTITFQEIIHEIKNQLQEGMIKLIAEKHEGNKVKIQLSTAPSYRQCTTVDIINALTTISKELLSIKNLSELGAENNLEKSDNGRIMFSVELFLQPPYYRYVENSSYFFGFSYEEIEKLVESLKGEYITKSPEENFVEAVARLDSVKHTMTPEEYEERKFELFEKSIDD